MITLVFQNSLQRYKKVSIYRNIFAKKYQFCAFLWILGVKKKRNSATRARFESKIEKYEDEKNEKNVAYLYVGTTLPAIPSVRIAKSRQSSMT
jgi:hypothetical protein